MCHLSWMVLLMVVNVILWRRIWWWWLRLQMIARVRRWIIGGDIVCGRLNLPCRCQMRIDFMQLLGRWWLWLLLCRWWLRGRRYLLGIVMIEGSMIVVKSNISLIMVVIIRVLRSLMIGLHRG